MDNDQLKKGYKRTEVGIIPEDWDINALSSTTPINKKNGIVDGPFGSNLKTIHYKKYGIPIITSGYVTEGIFQAYDYLYVDDEKFKQEKRSAVNPGDIVMAKIGARCGASAILPEWHRTGILSGNALKITVDNTKHSTYYIWQLLWNLYSTGNIEHLKTVGAQPAISMANLKKIRLPIPPLPEQRAIATALSDVDALIAELDKLIAKKRAIKTATMQKLLTGKKRLPGFGLGKGYKQTDIGKIPEDWDAQFLGAIFDFSGGFSATRDQLSSDGHCYLHYGDIHKSNKSFINVRVEYSDIPKLNISLRRVSPKSLLRDGDVVFVDASEDDEGTSKHIVVINHENAPFIAGLHTIVSKSKASTLENLYKRYCFQSNYIKRQFYFFSVGTKVSGISKTNIVKIKMIVPPIPEQKVIATILFDMDAEITALESRRTKTQAIKQGMMQELLTGRIRLI